MSYFKLKKRRVFVLFNLLILVLSLSLGNVVFIKPTRACHSQNPELEESCGIDMVLVIDSSSSMYGTPLQQEKDAFKNFIDSFLPNTPARIAIVDFDTTATLLHGFSNSISSLKNAIDLASTTPNITDPTDPNYTGEPIQYTNWQDALAKAYAEFSNGRSNVPNLIIFASDGNPNKYDNPAKPSLGKDKAMALSKAIDEADTIKLNGGRIITLGIGSDVDAAKLKAISSEDAYYNTDFDQLAQTLSELASDLCQSSIIVKKYVDGKPTKGWDFLASTTLGVLNTETGTTDEEGFFVFSLTGLNNQEAQVSISEVPQAGYILEKAVCKDKDDQEVGQWQEGAIAVANIPVSDSDTIYCDFFNITGPTCTAESSDYTELDRVDLGNNTSENYHTISGWSAANLPGNYGGCQQGSICSYRQVLGEPGDNQCTEDDREATVVLHTASSTLSKLIIRHLDGISLLDSFEVYVRPVNEQNWTKVGEWQDETNTKTEVWRTTEFDLWQFNFNGDIEVKLVATDNIWKDCPTYGQVSIDWIAVEGCGQAWQQPEPGSITVYKYIDFDGDADTAQDQVLATSTDWTFVLSSQATTTTKTTESGSTVFTNLLPGQYTVSEQAQDGWITLSPSDDYQINLNDSQNLELTFVNYYPYCGNGVIDEGEECDGQAGVDEGWHCTDECKLEKDGGGGNPVPVCGNGILEAGEECDDGNNIDGDGCSANCIKEDNGGGGGPVCGNGVVEAGEECDDGNTQNGDGCSADCTTESGGGFSYSGGQPIGGGGATGFSTGQTAGTNQTVVLGEEGAPNLSLTKTVNVEFTNPGQTIEYKLLLTNNGNLTAYNVVVTDTLPDGFSFKEGGGQTQTWDFGNLEAGETMAKTYLVVVGEDVKAGTYTNIAQASADNNDPVTAKANVDIRAVEVKGIELPASGFSWPEFMALLALLASTAGLSLYLKREEN